MPKHKCLAALLIALLCTVFSNTNAQELDSLKSATERWIEVRNRLAKEQADWKTERTLLASTIDTLRATRDSLEEKVEILKLESAKLTGETDVANETFQELTSSDSAVLEEVVAFEKRVLAISKRLPQPLYDKLTPLFRKIPSENSQVVSAATRLQNLVAIATQIDEFNNNLTLAHTIRSMEDGEVIEVRVLYWGLASAYATNSNGSKAWILSPSDSGWNWKAANEHATTIKALFDVYDKSIDPVMVDIPFTFQNTETSN